MKKLVLFAFCLTCIGIFSVQAQKGARKASASAPISLKTQNDTLSYAYGAGLVEQGLEGYLKQLGVISDTTEAVNKRNIDLFLKGVKESFMASSDKDIHFKGVALGSQFAQMAAEFGHVTGNLGDKMDKTLFMAGFESALKKNELLVQNPNQMIQDKYTESRDKVQAQQDAELKKQYATEIEMNENFLKANAKNEGVVTLPSGLQYKILTEGNGPKPTASDRVKVYYKGTLIDGSEFDGNIGKDPLEFGVGQVIVGWTEVLQLMPQGSKWEVYIPSDLGYGARDTGRIKPFSTLIFEIELLEVISGN